jgi:GT2 family glycosyltransferase
MSKPLPTLTVSLVIHTLDPAVIRNTLDSLEQAVEHARQARVLDSMHLTLINNGADEQAVRTLQQSMSETTGVISGHGNIGYGRGHNLAIDSADSDYHLILNPDAYLHEQALIEGLSWLQQNPGTVAVAPAIETGDGQLEYACKRYPSVLDFLLRGFAPAFIRRHFQRRLSHYEMQDLSRTEPTSGIPVISGCCMLFRTDALKKLGGFDARYFLYFEDFDLSLRAGTLGTLTFLPAMHITHLGGNSARKGFRHILMFGRSAVRFFNTHGWRWW